MTDWASYRERFLINLESILLPAPIETNEELQQAAINLTETIQKTIKEWVPTSKPCPYLKRWWNGKLQIMKKGLNKLSRDAMRQSNPSPSLPQGTLRGGQAIWTSDNRGQAEALDGLSGGSISQGPLDCQLLSQRTGRRLLGDAPLRPTFPPIFLCHLCIFLLIIASPRQSSLTAPIPESSSHVT